MTELTGPMPAPSSTADAVQALGALLNSDLLSLCIVRDGWLTYANATFARVFALGAAGSVMRFTSLVVEEDRLAVAERLAAIADGTATTSHFGFHGLLRDGTTRDFEFFGALAPGSAGAAIAGLLLDVTERQRTQARLSSLAFVDALTGLPNRAQFLDRLRDALASARAAGTRFALLIADLDGFKEINDSAGHDAGDLVLQVMATRLRSAARSNDTIARLGGDEFAMILPSIGTFEHAALVAGRVVRSSTDAIAINGNAFAVGMSVGVALYPTHGADMDRLVRAADTAMYEAKRGGRGRFAIASANTPEGGASPMRFIDWTEAASVGIELIDAQHRRMAQLINALGEDLKSIQPRDRVRATMGELVRFAHEHFATEEALLAAHAPEQFERHRRAHRRLLEDLESLANGVDEQSMALTMRYLQDWLFVHIEGADRPLGEAMIARGLS